MNTNIDAIDVEVQGPNLDKKSSFKMLRLLFFFKLVSNSYIFSIARLTFEMNERIIMNLVVLIVK